MASLARAALQLVAELLKRKLRLNHASTGFPHEPVHSVVASLSPGDDDAEAGATYKAAASASTIKEATRRACARLLEHHAVVHLALQLAAKVAQARSAPGKRQVSTVTDNTTATITAPTIDYKGKLQSVMSRAQACAKRMPGFEAQLFAPEYDVQLKDGMFTAKVTVQLPGGVEAVAQGVGQRKKRAQQEAAKMCLVDPAIEPWVRGFGERSPVLEALDLSAGLPSVTTFTRILAAEASKKRKLEQLAKSPDGEEGSQELKRRQPAWPADTVAAGVPCRGREGTPSVLDVAERNGSTISSNSTVEREGAAAEGAAAAPHGMDGVLGALASNGDNSDDGDGATAPAPPVARGGAATAMLEGHAEPLSQRESQRE